MARSKHVTRRQFLQTAGAVAGSVALYNSLSSHAAAPAAAGGFTVNIVSDPADGVAASPPAQWALTQLREALAAKGVAIRPPGDLTIRLGGMPELPRAAGQPGNAPESFSLSPSPDGRTLTLQGADSLGLVYALTELADRVRLMPNVPQALTFPQPVEEKPANRIRSILRMFAAEVEDKRWFYDREGWQKYLDLIVTHRFNRVNLSFGLTYDFSSGLTDTYTFFMYPFFVNVPGYNVRAIAKGGTRFSEEEQKKNLDTLKFISDQCALRGLKFTLGIWTHNYRWTNSPNATYTIDGLDAQTQAPYSRDAMKMLIDQCPGITGITLRTHGESGVPEGSYDLWKVIMSGITGHKNPDGTKRIIELDLHGKTMTQEMIDTAMSTGMPVIISCKQWAEHMGLPYVQASIREAEMPKGRDAGGLMGLSSGTRSFLRYGIGDLLTKDRKYQVIHRVWPGSQRLLLWGDPLYSAGFGRMANFAGMDGIDFFEPLSFRGRAGSSMNNPPAPDRSGYLDNSLRTAWDGEKYAYTYRLWGRLSYNPDAPAETWQRQLKSEFGPVANQLETALANTSRILPLITTAHDPSAANASYWPELYANQSIHNPAGSPYSEVPTPRVFGNVSSLDPQLFASINEYVDALLAGKPLAKISPLDVARQLDIWSNVAFASLAQADLNDGLPTEKTAVVRRAQIDATINAGLGQFFANKFRAAVLWQIFNLSGHEPARIAAADAYKKARDAWARLADTGKVYVANLSFGGSACLHGHWSDRLAAIDTDITGLATQRPNPRGGIEAATIDKLIAQITNPLRTAEEAVTRQHTPPASFTPGKSVALELRTAADSVRVCYRHVHQGERYSILDAAKNGTTFTAQIPAEYTNSAFPLQYYFEIHTGNSAALYPGFKNDFTGTPYFVVQQA